MKYRIIKRERFTIEWGFQEEYEPQKKGILPFWRPVVWVEIDSWGGTAPATFKTLDEAKAIIEKHKKRYDWIETELEV